MTPLPLPHAHRRRPVAAAAFLATALLAATIVLAVPGLSVLSGTDPAAAQTGSPPSSVALDGHGWGHGIGMGQWGALGYALQGQTYSWILGHYYGGTASATTPDSDIRVRIVENDGNDVIVTSASPFTVGGLQVPGGQAVLMHLASAGSWTISTGPGCGGPWTKVATDSDSEALSNGAQGGSSPATTTTGQAIAIPSSDAGTATKSQVLQLCQASGPLFLRGDIEAAEIEGMERTVNVLPIEQYLAGVVPSESPAYWGTIGSSGAQGQDQGFQALEAQAVAARSYAVADEETASVQGGTGEYGYADICDTTSCQVYGGLAAENTISSLAVSDTAGQILANSGGAAAYTEFSSSTGGWTAGGPFPSVVDAGDSVCVTNACNPNHDWTATVPASSIESAYPSIGTYESITVTSRSGPSAADYGGRVEEMTIQGSAGSQSMTGSTFASEFGLKSDWFEVTGTPSGGLDGYWAEGTDGSIYNFGSAQSYGSMGGTKLNRPMVGMAATPDGNGYWEVASDGGIFCFGDALFYGSTGAERLNQPIVGMASTPDGRGYWLVASDGGIFTFGDAKFYGSTGAERLNRPIVGMAPTPDGAGYWLVASDGGIFNFGDAKFYGSTGGQQLASSIVGMAPDNAGTGYWLLESAGTVHPFGSASSYGSPTLSHDSAVALAPTTDSAGYLIATKAGNIYSFGDAPNYGGVGQQHPGFSGSLLDLSARAGS